MSYAGVRGVHLQILRGSNAISTTSEEAAGDKTSLETATPNLCVPPAVAWGYYGRWGSSSLGSSHRFLYSSVRAKFVWWVLSTNRLPCLTTVHFRLPWTLPWGHIGILHSLYPIPLAAQYDVYQWGGQQFPIPTNKATFPRARPPPLG